MNIISWGREMVGTRGHENPMMAFDIASRYTGDLKNGAKPKSGCIAVLAAGRRRSYQIVGTRMEALKEILAYFQSEEGVDGEEYGLRQAGEEEFVIEILRRKMAPHSEYNDVGETKDPRFFGGPAPEGYLLVL